MVGWTILGQAGKGAIGHRDTGGVCNLFMRTIGFCLGFYGEMSLGSGLFLLRGKGFLVLGSGNKDLSIEYLKMSTVN
jgi:hypothetical protein